MKLLRGCTALITGASAGLGLELARQLGPIAHSLILVARRIERLNALKAELEGKHPNLRVLVYGLDLADETKLDEFLRWLEENQLRVDFLVNNAGLGDHGAFETSDWERIKSILAVNVVALTRLTHKLLPVLRRFDHAAILNVSSIAGFLPIPDIAVYAATKAYVTSFSEALRAELRGTGISVTALCPGPVDTEFHHVAERGGDGSLAAPEFFKVSAEKVVRDGLNAVAADRPRVVPGLHLAIIMGLACLTPMFILRFFMNRRG